jgi:hypothetical protein
MLNCVTLAPVLQLSKQSDLCPCPPLGLAHFLAQFFWDSRVHAEHDEASDSLARGV